MDTEFTSGIRQKLSELNGLSLKSQAADRRIAEAAEDRLRVVEAEIQKLRPTVLTDPSAADRYQALILERGRLQTLLSSPRS
jgi:glutathione S-transferase